MGTITFGKLKYVQALDLVTTSDLDARVREAELRLAARIEASGTDIIKWFVTSLFAQAAVIVAQLKLLP